jgi:hypothetical protein
VLGGAAMEGKNAIEVGMRKEEKKKENNFSVFFLEASFTFFHCLHCRIKLFKMASGPEPSSGSPDYAKDPEKYHTKCASVVAEAIANST